MLCPYLLSSIGKQFSRCLELMKVVVSESNLLQLFVTGIQELRSSTLVKNALTKPSQKTPICQSKITFVKILLV